MKTISTISIFIICSALIFGCKKKATEITEPVSTQVQTPASIFTGSWTVKASPVNADLKKIKFYNSKIGFIIGRDNDVLKTINGGATWSSVAVPTANDNYYGISIIDSLNIFLCSYESVLKTNDGGASWTFISFNPFAGGVSSFYDITFINSNTGFIIGAGGMTKTVDGGTTWNAVGGFSVSLNEIKFTDALTGWVNGSNAVYKTVDAGQTWTNCNVGVTSITSVFFLNNNTAFISSGINNIIKKTTDGGQTWTNVFNDNSLADSQVNMWYFDANKVVESRLLNRIRTSGDGGATWASSSCPLTNQVINGFYFFDINSGWAVGTNGLILKYN